MLGTAVGLVLAAALSPAGVGGTPVPPWAWPVWSAVFAAALLMFARASLPFSESLRRAGWLLPLVLIFTGPAALLSPEGQRTTTFAALVCRAMAAASTAAAAASWLGSSGMVRALRQLRVPARLIDIFEAMLASLTGILRQAHAMLRAREARRSRLGAWNMAFAAPADTVRGFGRLVAALLLRSMERAEALDRARRARGLDG